MGMEQDLKFTGTYTAIVTPFKDGKLDEPALERLVKAQIKAGVDGIVPVGTTGESPTLDARARAVGQGPDQGGRRRYRAGRHHGRIAHPRLRGTHPGDRGVGR